MTYHLDTEKISLDDLHEIQAMGINAFVKREAIRWRCTQCAELLNVHRMSVCTAAQAGNKGN
jgi:hypothetical protein